MLRRLLAHHAVYAVFSVLGWLNSHHVRRHAAAHLPASWVDLLTAVSLVPFALACLAALVAQSFKLRGGLTTCAWAVMGTLSLVFLISASAGSRIIVSLSLALFLFWVAVCVGANGLVRYSSSIKAPAAILASLASVASAAVCLFVVKTAVHHAAAVFASVFAISAASLVSLFASFTQSEKEGNSFALHYPLDDSASVGITLYDDSSLYGEAAVAAETSEKLIRFYLDVTGLTALR